MTIINFIEGEQTDLHKYKQPQQQTALSQLFQCEKSRDRVIQQVYKNTHSTVRTYKYRTPHTISSLG